jgi:hypothetical protein
MHWLKVIGDSVKHNWLAKTGAALVLFPLLILLAIYVHFAAFNWCPVNRPISLRPGTIEQTFTASYTTRYFIEIELQTGTLSQQTIRCLAGLTGFALVPPCTEERVLNVDWRLSREGKIVASGRYGGHGGMSASTIEPGIGYFDANRGEKYDLVVDVTSDASKLDIAKPTLYVEVNSSDVESALVLEGLSRVAALVFGVIGVILLVLGVSRYRGTLSD